MKAYIITTGTLFGLIAIMHFLKAISERQQMTTDPWGFFGMAALGLLAAGLSVWASRLLRRQSRS